MQVYVYKKFNLVVYFDGNEDINKIKRCNCGSVFFWPKLYIISSGAETYPLFCKKCNSKLAHSVSKKFIKNNNIQIYDQYINPKNKIKKCCVHGCINKGAERHHWAPSFLFPDSDRWPTDYLCVHHHKLWHKVVTPNMSESNE